MRFIQLLLIHAEFNEANVLNNFMTQETFSKNLIVVFGNEIHISISDQK